MNNPETNSKILLFILTVGFFILIYFWLVLPAMQISNERAKCQNTKIEDLQDSGEYLYCLQLVGEK